MTKDNHMMFERYVSSRKALNESIVPNNVGGSRTPINPSAQTNTKEAEEKANSKRILEILENLKNDANLATQFALSPEEFVSVLDWAKRKISGPSQAEETPSNTADSSMGMSSEPSQDEESIKEAVVKANDELEAAKNLKPRSEETEEEYLARRDSAIKAAIAAKEEAEEHAAMQSHYNTQNQALDLIDNLLKSPKKYQKADTIKILSLALDKLNGKA